MPKGGGARPVGLISRLIRVVRCMFGDMSEKMELSGFGNGCGVGEAKHTSSGKLVCNDGSISPSCTYSKLRPFGDFEGYEFELSEDISN